CGTFTGFVAVGGVTTMNASTKRFVAGPLPPGPELPDVDRTTVAVAGVAPGSLSANVHVAVAFAVDVPTDERLIVIVHVATLPLTVGEPHVFEFARSGVGETLGTIDTRVGVVPLGIAVAVTVKMCWFPTSFVLSCGVIVIRPSTKCLTAGPLPP